MKAIYLIPLLFISCGADNNKVITPFDTITQNEILASFDSTKTKLIFNGSDTSLQGELDATIAYINLLQTKVMSGQLSQVELISVRDQLNKVRSDKSYLFNKIDQLKKDKEQLEMDKLEIQSALKKTKQLYSISNMEVHSAKEETASLKKKFGTPTVAGVSIECFGFKTRFLKSPLQFKTDVAKEIKRIVIKFIIPANEIIEKKTYVFSIKISGILNKSVILKLTGEEMPVEPITFDIIDNVISGDHTVTIDCNGKNEYSGTLNFK